MHRDNGSDHTQACGGMNEARHDEILTTDKPHTYQHICVILKKGLLSFKMLPCFCVKIPFTERDQYSIMMIDSTLLVLFKSALQIRNSDNKAIRDHEKGRKKKSSLFLEILKCGKHQQTFFYV